MSRDKQRFRDAIDDLREQNLEAKADKERRMATVERRCSQCGGPIGERPHTSLVAPADGGAHAQYVEICDACWQTSDAARVKREAASWGRLVRDEEWKPTDGE